MHEMSIHFCVNLKVFCLPFCWHLMSVHLPRRCHSTAFSQNANLKTTLLLGKLHNIAKFLIIQLQDADKQIISAATDRVPDIMYFIVIMNRYAFPGHWDW